MREDNNRSYNRLRESAETLAREIAELEALDVSALPEVAFELERKREKLAMTREAISLRP